MRSIARQERWENSAAPAGAVLARRLLAEGVAAAIRATPSRVILVVSARSGDGKSHLFRTLAAVLATAEPGAWRFLDADAALRAFPSDIPEGCRALVDGASLLDGDGGIQLDDAWMDAIDGALIVLLAGKTKEEDLIQVRLRLEALKIPPVGVVWNDRDETGIPSPMEVLRRAGQSLRERLSGARGRATRPGPTPFPPVRVGDAANEPHAGERDVPVAPGRGGLA